MASPETIPLAMEPESGIYRDPVIVLDFQSLYPSMMIAYNYCFTTCLGKISNLTQLNDSIDDLITLGALKYSVLPIETLKELWNKNFVHVSPVGGIFLKKEVRKGLLSIMVEELLDTRIMVKKYMKIYKNDQVRYACFDLLVGVTILPQEHQGLCSTAASAHTIVVFEKVQKIF